VESGTVALSVRVDRESTSVEAKGPGGVAAAQHRLNKEGIESLERIRHQGGTDRSYGQALFDLAFNDDARYGFWSVMRPFSPGQSEGRFRLRLEIAADAPALQGLCWESLVDSQVFTRSVAYSRKGGFYRHVTVGGSASERPEASELKVLAAIAVPDLRHAPHLEPVDAIRHRALLEQEDLGLRQLEFVQAPVSKARLVDRLHEDDLRDCNVLHIVAPGGIDEQGPFILLEGDSGSRPEQLRPRDLEDIANEDAPGLELVVLVANNSADCPPASPDGSFGRRLLARGPTVVAVQGTLSSDMAQVLVEQLYRKVGADQLPLDQAVNLARSALYKLSGAGAEQQWAAPQVVLFSNGDEALDRFSDATVPALGQDDQRPGGSTAASPHQGRSRTILRSAKGTGQYASAYNLAGQEWAPAMSASLFTRLVSTFSVRRLGLAG
jgi:hypothetical protein